MIVTCPNCYCQFKVSLAVFGRDGRNVRCSACKETWWQEPTLEDVTEEIAETPPEDIFEPEETQEVGKIEEPEANNAVEEEFVLNAQERIEESESDQGRLYAYYVAAGLFAVILLTLWLISSSLLKSHPSMYGFYRFLGVNMKLPDTHSIMFEGVKAEREGALVTASGRIVNLSLKDWDLPMIGVVVFRPVIDEHGENSEEIIAQWIEKPPLSTLEAEKEIVFSFSRHISLEKKIYEDKVHDDLHGEKVETRTDDGHGDTSTQGLKEAKDVHDDMYMVRVHFVVRPELEEMHDNADFEDAHEEEKSGEGDHSEQDSHSTNDTHEAEKSNDTHGGSH